MKMSEYIDRQKAKYQLYKEFITEKETADRAFRALNNIPIIARCKYCRWHDNGLCTLLKIAVEPEFFCAYSWERVTDEQLQTS